MGPVSAVQLLDRMRNLHVTRPYLRSGSAAKFLLFAWALVKFKCSLNSGAPQGCVLSPFLLLLHTHNCNTGRWLCCEVCLQHHHHQQPETVMRTHIGGKSTVWPSSAQRTTVCSTSAKPRSWLLILGKRRGRHVRPCLHWWSWGRASEQFEVPWNQHHREPDMVITHLHPDERKQQNNFLFLTGNLRSNFTQPSSCQLLHRSNRKPPGLKHYKLAWDADGPGQEGSD